MKVNRHYIVSLIIIMLTAISFDISSPKLADSTSETKIQISLEEKETQQILDEKLIAFVPETYSKETKPFTGFDFSTPIVDQLYLNTIFKPPIFS